MIKLLRNNVGITPIFDPDVSPTGRIIIPDEAKERCDQGIVAYVGPQVNDLKIGDYVIFGGYDGTLVSIEDEGKLIIMPETQIKCIISDQENFPIPGLYFVTGEGTYYTACYEDIKEFVAQAFTDLRKHLTINSPVQTEALHEQRS